MNLSRVEIPSGYPSCRSSKSAVSILCGFLKRESAAQSAYSAHPACVTMGVREGNREGEGKGKKEKREKGKKGKREKGKQGKRRMWKGGGGYRVWGLCGRYVHHIDIGPLRRLPVDTFKPSPLQIETASSANRLNSPRYPSDSIFPRLSVRLFPSPSPITLSLSVSLHHIPPPPPPSASLSACDSGTGISHSGGSALGFEMPQSPRPRFGTSEALSRLAARPRSSP